MSDDTWSQLRRVVADYDEKLAEADRIRTAHRAAYETFPGRFADLKTTTIRPTTIQEIADMLNERGHRAYVQEQEESSSAVGGVKSAAISLRVVPRPFVHKATEDSASTIEVTFSANRGAQKVTVSSTNTIVNHGGAIGKRGEYDIEAVVAQVIARPCDSDAAGGVRGGWGARLARLGGRRRGRRVGADGRRFHGSRLDLYIDVVGHERRVGESSAPRST